MALALPLTTAVRLLCDTFIILKWRRLVHQLAGLI